VTGEEATIDPKDITYDILIDDTERPDRGGSEVAGGPAKPQGDHPVVTILDMAVRQSGEMLKKQSLPPANNDVYTNFSRPFLNEAAWHYLPDGALPDDPRFALALGVGGLALAFAPTLIAVYQKQEEEKRRELEEKKRRKQRREEEGNTEEREITNPVTGAHYSVAESRAGKVPVKRSEVSPDPVPEPPWLERLDSGGLVGM